MKTAKHLKKILMNNLKKLATEKGIFLFDPQKDFSRSGPLDFSSVMELILTMECGTLKEELLKFFDFDPDTVSASAFVQARSKISFLAFEKLFDMFNHSSKKEYLYKGYGLIAIDGSSIPISYDRNDTETLCPAGHEDVKGYNAFHITAAYDLLEHTYDDLVIQGEACMNENGAFNELVDRSTYPHHVIFIADRGFESFNSFVHVMKKDQYFLIRVKDIHSRTSVARSFGLPEGEFDLDVKRIFTRRYTNEIKAHPEIYKFMPQKQRFDFFGDNKFFDFECRVVRFKITEDTYETIFTNLDRDEFPPDEIKKLSNMRWGIETSFRQLKYAIGLNAFHAKKRNSIKQEIYARLILYNFCERVVRNIKIKDTKRKYEYQINFTNAFRILREFLKKKGKIHLPNVEVLIAKEILPIRPGRSDPRKIRPKSMVYFNYRFN